MTISYVDRFPIWAIYLLFAAIAFGSIEIGWQIGNKRRLRSTGEGDTPIGTQIGAILGLLAFLLAFIFGMAGERFENRKKAVLDEANAIGTTYLRADFLSEQGRDAVRDLLRDYTALRAGGASAILSKDGMLRSTEIQDRLWSLAEEEMNSGQSISISLFIQSLNDLIDLDSVRITILRNRIPDTIWFMLGLVTFFSMMAVGYLVGLTGKRNWIVTILMVVVFISVITLIADLDRPQTGFIQVSQQPLLDLLEKITISAP